VTEYEIANQKVLLELAAEWGANQVIDRAVAVTAKAAGSLYDAGERNGRLYGFWYGFAAGAFGVVLSLAVTWLIYGGAR
jgi:hypothetical protein